MAVHLFLVVLHKVLFYLMKILILLLCFVSWLFKWNEMERCNDNLSLILMGLIILIAFARQLTIMELGDTLAKSLGQN